jgi:membrane associated rhomboid family serine protease
MGFLDRDYYREEGGHPVATWFRQGLITKILVFVSIVAYMIEVSSQDYRGASWFTDSLALVADRVLRGEAWRLFTYSLLHQPHDLLPFLLDMPLLWVIGHAVEEHLGRKRYGAFLAAATLAAGLAMVGAAKLPLRNASPEFTRIVGCSPVLAAMLVWLILQSPRERLTFFYALTVPAWSVLALSLVLDAWSLVWPSAELADGRRLTLAGDFGALLFATMIHGLLRQSWPRAPARRRRAPLSDADLRLFREEPDDSETDDVPAPVPASPDLDEHLEAQLDAVLAKVAQQGQQSLTSAEREILNRASEVYRKRRR